MQLYRSLDDISGKQFYSVTHRIVVGRDHLVCATYHIPHTTHHTQFSILGSQLSIKEPIELEIKEVDIVDFQLVKSANVACLDANKLQYPLTLRRWQKGDWFIPFGMKGRKKLSDFFADKKMSLIDKEQVWLLTSGDDIVWVVGHRVDARFAVTEKTKKVKIFIL
jgi:tRNA(Ile)-lysidine synthase